MSNRITQGPLTAWWVLGASAIYLDGMSRLHPALGGIYYRIRGLDNVTGGPVVVGEESRSRPVVGLETAYELHRGAVEGVDVLVIVAYGEETELLVVIGEGPARQG